MLGSRVGLSAAISVLLMLILLNINDPIHAQTPTPATIPADATTTVVREGAQIGYGALDQITLYNAGATTRVGIFGQYGDLVSVGVYPANGQAEAPAIELDAPDGTIVGNSNGVSGGAPGALIPAVTLPATGLYELYIQATDPQATGVFLIRTGNDWILRDMPGGALVLNTLSVGRLSQASDRQDWQIELSAGTTFSVLAQPSGDARLDPVIDVTDPLGIRLGVAHDFSDLHQAKTDTFTAGTTGLYSIRISSYVDASTGAYDLIVNSSS